MTGPTGLRYGYISNGLGDHRLSDAIELLAENGYDALALTLDHHHLDPYAPGLAGRVGDLAVRLDRARLGVSIETGARFLLDPRRKHHPTLVSDEAEGRAKRIDFYRLAIAIAADLGAETVSFWSGVVTPGTSDTEAWDRLVEGCEQVLRAAEQARVRLAFEPEPGMLVADIDGWDRLHDRLGRPDGFGLTLDLGHCLCAEREPVPNCIRRGADHLVNVHVEDMRHDVHDHLDFGEGELDLFPALGALHEIGYRGLVSVELSRHSHTAHTTVPRAIQVLQAAEAAAGAEQRRLREEVW
jgi:sugar phosphate isomerase/epimerase